MQAEWISQRPDPRREKDEKNNRLSQQVIFLIFLIIKAK
jgi:hypothetical protein